MAAALQCLHAGGADGLTMRAVAARLETGPASLYAHVRDVDDLTRLVVDEAAASALSADVPDGDAGVIGLLRAYAQALYGIPGSARLALLTTPTGQRSLDLLERLLALATASGRSLDRATRVVDAGMLLVTASVAEQDARRHSTAIPAELLDAASGGATERPLLVAAVTTTAPSAGADNMTWAVSALLSGADAIPDRPSNPRATRRGPA